MCQPPQIRWYETQADVYIISRLYMDVLDNNWNAAANSHGEIQMVYSEE